MTSLFFDIFGRDQGATQAFNQVGQAADNAGTRLAALNTQMQAAARAEQEATTAMEQAAQRETAARTQAEQAANKLRDAETQLDNVRRSIAPTADNIASAEQRVSQARKEAETAERALATAEQDSVSAAERLTTAHNSAGNAARQHASALKEAETSVRSFDTSMQGLVQHVEQFNNMNLGSTMFAAIGASIQPLLASIGQLSGALGILPAAITAVGTAFGTAVIGVQGMGTALQNAGKSSEAAATATKADATAQQATSAARQAATAAIGGNAAALDKAKQAQDQANQATTAAKSAHEQAKQAADAYAQSLTNLAPAAQQVVSALVQLKPAFDDVRKAVQEHLFEGIATDLQNLGQSVLPVVKTGLTQMADALNNAIKQVAQFAQEKTSISDWKQIFADVAQAVNNFAGAIKPILQIFTDLTAVGAPMLAQLAQHFADAAQKAAEFVSNARQTGQLQQWIQTGLDAVKELWDALKNVVAIIKDLATAQGFGPNFLQALDAVTGAIRWIIENVPGATTIIQAFFDAWVIAKVVQGLTTMATTIGTVITSLKNLVTANEEAAASSEAAAGRASAAWKAVGLAILAVAADAVLPQNTPDQEKQAQDNPLTSGYLAGQRDELHGIADAIKDPMKALQDLKQELQAFPGQVANSPLVNFFKQLGPQVTSAISGLSNTISQKASELWTGFVNALTTGFTAVTTFFQGIGQKISTAVGSAANWISSKAQEMWTGFTTALNTAWNTVAAWFQGIGQKIATAVGNAATWLSQKAQDLWTGFTTALNTAWNAVATWFQQVGQKIATAVGDATQWLVQKAQDLWTGFTQALDTAWNTVATWFQQLGQKIVQAVGDLSQTLVQAAQSVMQGFFQAMEDFYNNTIAPWLQSIAQSIQSLKGPPDKDYSILQDAGTQIMAGFHDAMQSRWGSIATWLGGLGAQVQQSMGSVDMSGAANGADGAPGADGSSGSSGYYGGHRRHGWGDWWRHGRSQPLPQQLMMTAGGPDIASFGVGSAVTLSGSALPIMPGVLSTTYNPGTRATPNQGTPGRGGGIHISSNSALINELLRMIRSEVRKQGGNVQNVLGY